MSKPTVEPPSSPAMAVEMWPVDRPRPYAKNARKWSGRAIEKVANSIREFGWRQPIVCDAEDVVVIGHLRLAAARYLGLTEVPVHTARDLSPAQIKALRIADNRTHEEAEWDGALLGPELIDLKIADFNLDLTGFETDEIIQSVFGESRKSSRNPAGESEKSAGGYKEQYGVIVICKDESHQQEIYDALSAAGHVCKIVVT